MLVGFDRQTFVRQRFGGISRYFADLYFGLLNEQNIDATLLFTRHKNEYLHSKKVGKKLSDFASKAYIKILENLDPSIEVSNLVDVHHATYYMGRPNKSNTSVKLVSTLYDMIPENYPYFFGKSPHLNKLEWLNSSDLIISISDSSAADLTYYNPELASRIRRIHLHSNFENTSAQKKPKGLGFNDSNYYLYVGARGGYKNAATLLRAFANTQPKKHSFNLVFAGGGPLTPKELAEIFRLQLSSHILQLNVSDEELWYLYKHTKAIVVPSISEGFSLPVVEGLLADKPIICSNIPVHKEVAGSYAELIDPLAVQDWSGILSTVNTLTSPSQRLGLSNYKSLCSYYSRERMVNEHINAYKSIIY